MPWNCDEHSSLTRMDFDDMLNEIGELGRYQITNYILVCLPVLFAAANSLSYVFTAGEPFYRCLIPECENIENATYKSPFISWAIPHDGSDDTKYSSCTRYAVNRTLDLTHCNKEMFTNQIVNCKELVFDHDERTIVSDWNLTCAENEWKISLIGSSHFAGIVVGSALFGLLADKYGRKSVFIFCIILMSISGIIQAFSPEYITFVVLTFINAMGTSGVYPLAFIIGVEMVGKKKRELTGIVLNYFYAVGEALVGLIAWLWKDWQAIQLIVAAPPILFTFYYWIIPESVRWLLAHYETEKAKGIICRAAKVNRVSLSKSLLDTFEETMSVNQERENTNGNSDLWPIVKEMANSKKMVLRFVIVYFIWAVNAFVYYGLSLNSTSIAGNKYLNFSLVCLIEIPGYTMAWICIKKIGRKISLVASLFLCGLTCTLTIFVSGMPWVDIILFLLGKLGITSSFGVVYVYTAELLPTTIRSGGVGSASTIARLGALVAPFERLLPKPFPMVMFGSTAIIAGILAFKLPETLGNKLPESVKEAKKL